jgi:hypothetical protein
LLRFTGPRPTWTQAFSAPTDAGAGRSISRADAGPLLGIKCQLRLSQADDLLDVEILIQVLWISAHDILHPNFGRGRDSDMSTLHGVTRLRGFPAGSDWTPWRTLDRCRPCRLRPTSAQAYEQQSRGLTILLVLKVSFVLTLSPLLRPQRLTVALARKFWHGLPQREADERARHADDADGGTKCYAAAVSGRIPLWPRPTSTRASSERQTAALACDSVRFFNTSNGERVLLAERV